MDDRRLLPTQMGQVLDDIKAAGLWRTDFYWEKVGDRGFYWQGDHVTDATVSKLVHRLHEFYCIFVPSLNDRSYSIYYAPGPTERQHSERYASLAECRNGVRQWLACLKRELGAAKLWAEVAKQRERTSAPELNVADEPLTRKEQEYIRQMLVELKQVIARRYDLSEAQLGQVRGQLAHLELAAARATRRDWIMMASGLVPILVQLGALAAQQAAELWPVVASSLDKLIGGPTMLPS